MTSKRANWLFLSIILVHFGVVAFLLFAGGNFLDNIVLNFLLSQGILIVPTLVFLLLFERGQILAVFHRVKISTLLMIALCTFLIMPLVTVLNALTMLFADNAVASLEGDIVSTPFPVMLFMIGIFGPFCEEFVFRGVIYGSYRKGRDGQSNGIAAVLLASLLFGLMHLNFNQAVYAFAIGIFLAILVEAAGSLWASVFCHVFFNSCQVVMMYASKNILGDVYEQAVNGAAQQLSAEELLAALSVYLMIASVTTPVAGCVIVWIAKNEGRQEALRELFGRRPAGRRMAQQPPQPPTSMPQYPQQAQTDYLLSVPLIIAVVLCLGYMSLEFF